MGKPPLKSRLLRWLAHQLTPWLYKVPLVRGQHPVNIGKNVGLGNTVLNARSGSITIGDNVVFGHNVLVLTGVHDVETVGTFRPTLTDDQRDIIIEDNAWIASGAILLGPLRVGRNSVVAAGSIVTKDVPEAVIVAGNPARVIREIKPETKVAP